MEQFNCNQPDQFKRVQTVINPFTGVTRNERELGFNERPKKNTVVVQQEENEQPPQWYRRTRTGTNV
jgi:hypothetical protein